MHKTLIFSIALFIILLPAISFGQYSNTFLTEIFFGRQPSTRAETMGKAYSSIDGDLSSVFYNPAGTATLKGLEVNASFASPYYLLDKADYNFISVGYKFNNYLIIAISRNNFNYGLTTNYTDSIGYPIGQAGSPNINNYCLTLSSQPFKNWLVGINVNYFKCDVFLQKDNILYLDLGIIKKFEFLKKKNSQQTVNIGASICNFNYAKMTLKNTDGFQPQNEIKENLPVITRVAANYQFILNKHLLIDTLNTIEFIAQAEYQDVLNSDNKTSYHFGGEVKLLEILSLRAGYYHQKVEDFNYPDYNKDNITSFTYGFGLQIPLYKLCKLPFNINFDYTSLPQPTYIKNKSDWDNFTSYNCRINWIL